MDVIINFGLEATQWLQMTFPQLEAFFRFVSTLGTEEFYLAFLPFIYWCLHKTAGKHYAYIFLFSNSINNLFKHGLRGPRPFWLDAAIGLDSESTYGVPSNHIQSATVTYFFLASWIKRRWAWVLAVLMVLAMGISRVYLGVHFVHDVVVGFVLGLLVLLGYFIWQRRLLAPFHKRILGFRLMVVFIIPILLALIYSGMLFLIGTPNQTVPWADLLPSAEKESIESMTTAVSALFGLGIGVTLESSRIRFRVQGPVWKRFFRYLIGMIVTLGIWAGLGNLFPDDPLWLAVPLRFFRYTLLTLWVAYYAPWLFVKIGLSDQDPKPEHGVSL
ncbi:MAG: phosphatase PAP2 family protein [Anaerolineales bacterium]|nr:phosphatase PAP2 family protein [Anaerolineales bacterium]